jgi:WD40 repeat protein
VKNSANSSPVAGKTLLRSHIAPIRLTILPVLLLPLLAGCFLEGSPLKLEASPAAPYTPSVESVLTPLSSPTSTQTLLPEPTAVSLPEASPEENPTPEHTAEPTLTATLALEAEDPPAEEPGKAALLSSLDFGPWEHVLALAWNPTGNLLAASAGENVFIISYPSLEVLYELPVGASTESLAFSPGDPGEGGSPLLALAVKDGSIQIWDPESGELSCSFPGHRNGAKSLAFLPDGSRIATAGMDPMVRIWNLTVFSEEGVCPLPLRTEMIGSARAVPDVAVHPEGSFLASIDLRQIRMREIDTQRILGTISAGEAVYRLAFSPDGRWVAGALAGDRIKVWDAGSYSPVVELSPTEASRPRVFTWKIAFHPSGKWIAAGSSTGAVNIWQVLENGENQPIFTINAHQKSAAGIAFHPNEDVFASGGLDGKLVIWTFSP